MLPIVVGPKDGLHKDGQVVVRSFDLSTWTFGAGTTVQDNKGGDQDKRPAVLKTKSKGARTLVQVDANNNKRWGDADRFFLFGKTRLEMVPLLLDGRDGLAAGDRVVLINTDGRRHTLRDNDARNDLDLTDNGKFSTVIPKGWNGTVQILGAGGLKKRRSGWGTQPSC